MGICGMCGMCLLGTINIAKNAIWVSAHVHMSGLGISKPQGGPDFLNDFCEFIIWLFNIAMENHNF
jgi:hypothetical protein